MRAEEIQKESKLYSGPDECYIHYECTGEEANCVMRGGGEPILRAMATFLLNVEHASGFSRRKIFRDLKQTMKDIEKFATFTDTREK